MLSIYLSLDHHTICLIDSLNFYFLIKSPKKKHGKLGCVKNSLKEQKLVTIDSDDSIGKLLRS